jgi:hypothetical protein
MILIIGGIQAAIHTPKDMGIAQWAFLGRAMSRPREFDPEPLTDPDLIPLAYPGRTID